MALRVILSLNSGSSSLKFALYRIGVSEESVLAHGGVELKDGQVGHLWIHAVRERVEMVGSDIPAPSMPWQALAVELKRLQLTHPDAVGHRLVHGGRYHAAPELITDTLLSELRSLIPFTPLHLPNEIAGIDESAVNFEGVPQVACFDRSFHRSIPEVAQRFPLPGALWDDGIRRYGFHGISYEYIMRALGSRPPAREIIADLGNGASMATVKDGSPLDTTMEFTPAGGLMMGTRCGDLDAGILLYLLSEKHFDASRLEELVNYQSGLLGVSGISDMKLLLETRNISSADALAVQMFCYQSRKQIGAYAAALGGLDLLAFTGGIGEGAAPVRWETCLALEHLGIRLDRELNGANEDTIGTNTSLASFA